MTEAETGGVGAHEAVPANTEGVTEGLFVPNGWNGTEVTGWRAADVAEGGTMPTLLWAPDLNPAARSQAWEARHYPDSFQDDAGQENPDVDGDEEGGEEDKDEKSAAAAVAEVEAVAWAKEMNTEACRRKNSKSQHRRAGRRLAVIIDREEGGGNVAPDGGDEGGGDAGGPVGDIRNPGRSGTST